MVGGITGGLGAELSGGNFAQGFGQGAAMAAAAYVFNEGEVLKKAWFGVSWAYEFAFGRGTGINGANYTTYGEPSKAGLDVDRNFGLGGSGGLSFGFIYASDPSRMSGSLNVCFFTCATIPFQDGRPVGLLVGKGGMGLWSSGSLSNLLSTTWGKGMVPSPSGLYDPRNVGSF